jgi:hypothetical protein
LRVYLRFVFYCFDPAPVDGHLGNGEQIVKPTI